jgi:hypothetical protein
MKTKDLKAFADLAESLGYEVQNIGATGGPMPGAQLAKNPDGDVVETEISTITLIRKTTYPQAKV